MDDRLAFCRVISCAKNWNEPLPDEKAYEIRRVFIGVYPRFPSREGRWRDELIRFHYYTVRGRSFGFCDDCVTQEHLNKLSLLGRADH